MYLNPGSEGKAVKYWIISENVVESEMQYLQKL